MSCTANVFTVARKKFVIGGSGAATACNSGVLGHRLLPGSRVDNLNFTYRYDDRLNHTICKVRHNYGHPYR